MRILLLYLLSVMLGCFALDSDPPFSFDAEELNNLNKVLLEMKIPIDRIDTVYLGAPSGLFAAGVRYKTIRNDEMVIQTTKYFFNRKLDIDNDSSRSAKFYLGDKIQEMYGWMYSDKCCDIKIFRIFHVAQQKVEVQVGDSISNRDAATSLQKLPMGIDINTVRSIDRINEKICITAKEDGIDYYYVLVPDVRTGILVSEKKGKIGMP